MAEVVYLAEGDEMPDAGEDTRWLCIESNGNGRFFGSGGSWKETGEWVGYGSLAEDDVTLERALAAAQAWAAKYRVPTIWVEASR
jgi:hypothetical protein